MRRRVPAAVAAVALSLASCSGEPDESDATGVRWGSCQGVTDLSAPPVPPERLARLSFSCGRLTVPLDRTRPAAGTFVLQLIRATTGHDLDATRPIVLLVPGGPASSGVDNHAFLVGRLSDRLLAEFDVVGFDPRGVKHSNPIRCEHVKRPATLPDVSTDAGYAAAARVVRTFTEECLTSLGDRASLFGTTAAAADIDAIRAALGQTKLTFVGGSYGAKLGAEYARLYPGAIRAGVLDAPTDPQTSAVVTAEHQVKGFEDSLDEFIAWCLDRSCPRLTDVRAFIAALVAEADRSPIRSGRPQGDEPMRGSEVLDAVASSLYDVDRWPDLAAGLIEADDGDSGTLWDLRDASGNDPDDTTESDGRFVINCTDSGAAPTEAEIRRLAAHFKKSYPTFGVWGTWQLFGCSFWTAPKHTLPVPVAEAAPPLMVIGTIHDPATPYAGAVSMTRVLGNGSTLITWEGFAHAAFTRDPCIDALVDAYLISLSLPSDGTRCAA
ncbi:alpha/beta hydrolase [Phycicoccus sp. Soil803]|uniref:alpha/beta hydrolase n=1 Tax=Phycicoccus sp. Soil803 TaxID=1736415 RepID=UPI00138F2EB8|nr:alpha/beta hydrolase [Phycicoccus sp. Soil803]